MLPMIASNDLLGQPEALQARLKDKGYLLFRNAIPQTPLLKLRKDIINILATAGWIKQGEELMNAIAHRIPLAEGEADEGFFEVYDEVMKLESFYGLGQDSALTAVMKEVLGESAFPHPLSVARLTFPKNNETTTPPHQDYPNNQGTKNLTATWIPLSDCPQSLGGVSILEGSHKFDEILSLEYSLGAGKRTVIMPEKYKELNWVATDFKLGDFLVFPSLTVHKALDNLSAQTMRLSVDFRFQQEGEALTENVLKPHFQRFDWEEVYANWESKEHQYYWKNKNYIIEAWDPALHEAEDFNLYRALKMENDYKKERELRTENWRKE